MIKVLRSCRFRTRKNTACFSDHIKAMSASQHYHYFLKQLRNSSPSETLKVYNEIRSDPTQKISRGLYNMLLNKLASEFPSVIDQIKSDMTKANIPLDESSYLAFIRAKGAIGDIDGGLKLIDELDSSGVYLRVRNFVPLLQSAHRSDPPKLHVALMVWEKMFDAQVQPLESECIDMINSILTISKLFPPYEDLCWYAVEEVLSKYLFRVNPTISQAGAEQLHRKISEIGIGLHSELKPSSDYVELMKDGTCPNCLSRITVLSLSEEERKDLIDSLFDQALYSHETHFDDLKAYASWIDSIIDDNRFTVVVDGANVAYHGQNVPGGLFSFEQVDMVVKALQAEGEKPMVVLPAKYMCKQIPNTISLRSFTRTLSSDEEIIRQRWKEDGMLFTPENRGADDDWYWMYASVANSKGLTVVTNDETRNHRPASLDMRIFHRWRQSKVRRFYFKLGLSSLKELTIFPLAQYCREMQSGTSPRSTYHWHIPVDDHIDETEPYDNKVSSKSWLCIHLPVEATVLETDGVGEGYLSALARQIKPLIENTNDTIEK
jgi:hypothetical protein